MADTKISDLTAVVTPDDADEFAVNQSFTSKKITAAQLKQDLPRAFVATFGAFKKGNQNITLATSAPVATYVAFIHVRFIDPNSVEETGNVVATLRFDSDQKGAVGQSDYASFFNGAPSVFDSDIDSDGQTDSAAYVFRTSEVADITMDAVATDQDLLYRMSTVLMKIETADTELYGCGAYATINSAYSNLPSITFDPDDWYYAPGTEVELTADPEASGAIFDQWLGDVPAGHETDNPLTVTMDQARSLIANFLGD